jgi:hypothetical protein
MRSTPSFLRSSFALICSMRPATLLSGVLGGLALLSGCGGAEPAASAAAGPAVTSPAKATQSATALTDAFLIDDGVGVSLPEDAFAITVNGSAWALSWRGDADFHSFTGTITNGSSIDGVVFAGGFAGDWVTQPDVNSVQFSASTDGADVQSITLDSGSQPVTFDLYVDGYPATNAVVFSSGGVESTSDVMPFDLLTGDGVRTTRPAPRLPAARTGTVGQAAALASDSSTARRTVFVPAPARRSR